MSRQSLPVIPFDVQDQLADAQHAVYAAFRRKQLDGDFVFGRLRALLGTTLPADVPTAHTAGLLGYFQFEINSRLFAEQLDPHLTLQALTDTLKEGLQWAADRFVEQLSRDLVELAKQNPKDHNAYQIVRTNQSSRDYAAWLEQLSAHVNSQWGATNLAYPFTLSERLMSYVGDRKDVASKAEQQMRKAGYEANSSLIHPVQHQAAIEASVWSAAHSFWDHLRLSSVVQAKRAVRAA